MGDDEGAIFLDLSICGKLRLEKPFLLPPVIPSALY
jgi:hypothetical protein